MLDFGEVLQEVIADTLYLVPFLLATYLLMEWLEHRTGAKTQEAIRRAGAAGPVVGALLGVIPQCGFSAVSATLYAGRVITLGTLFAVFLSTSDEMLPIFLAQQVPAQTILAIMGAKVLVAMVMGFIVDAAVRLARRDSQNLRIHELCEQDACGCGPNCKPECATCADNPALVYEHNDDCSGNCNHEHHLHNHNHDHDHGAGWRGIFQSALKHTAQVMIFIFLITLALDCVIEWVGEDTLAQFVEGNPGLSVVASALIGLVPNCAASIVIADLYVEGVLGAGAMFSGLLVSAGVGLLVLFRANRPMVQNFFITAGLFCTGILWGSIVNLLGL